MGTLYPSLMPLAVLPDNGTISYPERLLAKKRVLKKPCSLGWSALSSNRSKIMKTTLRAIDFMRGQKPLDDRDITDMKDSIKYLGKHVDSLKFNQNAFPMLYQLLFYLTCPDNVNVDKVTPLDLDYQDLVFPSQSSASHI